MTRLLSGRARRLAGAMLLPLALAACGAESKWDSDEFVARSIYRHPGPSSITLITVYNMRGDEGVHSGLMINAGQRVIFDPAGSWWNPIVPERNDVQYGITPPVEKNYIDYHARPTYYVVTQEVTVSPEVAALALAKAEAYGPVPKAFCSNSITAILGDLPGFEAMGSSYFPGRTAKEFAKLPNVRVTYYYDDDTDNTNPLRVQAARD